VLLFGGFRPVNAFSFSAEINKSFAPIAIVAGQTSRLSITIFNPNTFQLDNASFTDNLVGVQPGLKIATPANLSNTCGGVVVTAAGTTTIALSGGTVPAQVGVTPGSCTIGVDVTSTVPGNLINTIPAYGVPPAYGGVGLYATARGGLDTITNTTPASATLQVNAVQPPTMSKNFNPNTVWVGQSSELAVTIHNNDLNNVLTQATFTDNLPSSFTVSAPLTTSLTGCGSGTLTASVGATSFTLNNATIAPNSNCVVRVRVVSSTQGEYTNTIPAGPSGTGSLQTQQGVTNTSPVVANINVQAVGISKSFNPTSFAQGDTSTLTITLRNPTGASYEGVGLVDNLPAGLTVFGTPVPSQCGGTVTATANSITLTNGIIPAGTISAPGTCTIVAQVTSTTVGSHTNTIPAGRMTGPTTNVLPASASVTVTARTIGVSKSFSPGNFIQSGSVTLTIRLTNTASTAFTGVSLTDTMPAALQVVGTPTLSTSCGVAAVVTSTTNSISLSNAVIPPGTVSNPGECIITATITSTTAGTHVNSIPANDVTSAQGIGNSSSASGSVIVYAVGANATVAKSFQNSPILAGSSTRLRITITAPNDTSLSSISISDTLPDGLVISSPPAPSTTCGGTLTAVVGTNLIRLTGGSIANPGASCNIDVYVTSGTPGSYVNSIPGGTLTTFEGRTDPNTRSATLTVSNFTISKAFTPGTIAPNGLSRLTISLRNTNLLPLTNASLTDNLATMNNATPGDVRVAPVPNEVSTCGGTVTALAGTQTISLTGGTIPASDGVVAGLCTVSVNVQAAGGATTRTNTINTTAVSANLEGLGLVRPVANATANLTITPLSIQVVKGFLPLTVFGGSSSVMSIQLTNPTTSPLSNIGFTDTMPNGMILADPVAFNVGGCGGVLTRITDNQFTFSGGSLAGSGSCTMTMNVTMTVIGNLTNTIGAGAVTTFEGATNPQATSASLTNLPGASVSKSFSPNPIRVGEYSLLTILIQNTSNVALTGMGLVDNLPANLTVAAIPPAPVLVNTCGGDLTANSGASSIQLTGGALAGLSTCTLVIPVTSNIANQYQNTIPANTLTADDPPPTNETSDTLLVTSFSLGNRVWDDNGAGGGTANDGIRNGAEPGISGVTVNLYEDANDDGIPDGAAVATTTTSASGYYRFDNLAAGTYIVEVLPPAGYRSSTTNGGDPDVNPADNDNNGALVAGSAIRSYPVTLGPGATEPTNDNDPSTNPEAGEGPNNQSNRTVDFGLFRHYSLGNFVWNDDGAGGGISGNGVQDGTESGMAGVSVRLYRDTNADGIPDGAVIQSTVTNANGYYRFDNLTQGNYVVEVVTPTGYTRSPVYTLNPNSDIDSDNNGAVQVGIYVRSGSVALGPGAVEPTNDNDPATNPEAGEAPNDQSNRTIDFAFTPAYSLGNRVWNDNGAGGGTENNGLRDGSEPGIDGVTVNLYRDGNLFATTTTAGGGYYRFDGLPAGDYIVEVAIPAGFVSSSISEGNPNTDIDNDNNGVNLVGGFIRSNAVTLGTGASEPANDNDPATNPQTGEAANNYSNRTVDFGFYYPPYSLGNRVWNDNGAGGGTANNGIRDGTEPGISGVTVRLYRDADANGVPDGSAIAFTTTNANGYYRFDFLQEGIYLVEVVIPSGYTRSVVVETNANNDVDDDNNGAVVVSNTVRSGPVTLGMGLTEPTDDNDPSTNPEAGEAPNNQSNRTVDFGFVQLAAIGDRVWFDFNQNGIQDTGENGLIGVRVDLYRPGYGPDGIAGNGDDSQSVATTTTGGGGFYRFNNLIPGDYYLVFTPPASYEFSPIDQGADDALDSDANLSTGQTVLTSLSPGEADLTWDAGMYTPYASLGDRVWVDLNLNGIQDGSESGLDGVTVELYRPGYGPDGIPFTSDDGQTVATATTAGGGLYLFNQLVPGNYEVLFILPAGYVFSPMDQGADNALDSDANPSTGRTVSIPLVAGQDDRTWDVGVYQLASLGNFVWNDINRNGIQDTGETGVAGVTVELYTGTGSLAGTTTTISDGTYQFINLMPGEYYLIFYLPGGYAFSPADQGGNDEMDSDADPGTGRTATTNLISGENDLTWDAGMFQLASIGNFVWEDQNRNGIQDSAEPGINEVTVSLYTNQGVLAGTTTTAGGGYYTFSGLVPGEYYVVFTLPTGYQFSPINQGSDDALDSDADLISGQTSNTILDPGENDPTWDAGMYLIPAAIGDRVWLDVNGNGVQDAGEPGINGVSVALYNQSGVQVGTTTTASIAGVDGLYGFINLTPGYYYLVFTTPNGYRLTLVDQGGNDALDSDAIPPSGETALTLLDPGEIDLGWDAGYVQTAALGNFVWHDINANGIQDAGETGIGGVSVSLYRVGAGFISTTTTDGNGLYSFVDLIPGDYYLVFTPPANYYFSPVDQGADDALDSDASAATGQTAATSLVSGETDLTWDAGLYQYASLGNFVWHDLNGNGIQETGEPGIDGVTVTLYTAAGAQVATTTTAGGGSYSFTNLVPGAYYVVFTPPVGYSITLQDQGTDDAVDSDADRTSGRTATTMLTSGENDITWDAGLYQPAALGNFVWHDTNGNGIQEVGEPGIDGVTVNLYTATGTFAGTQVTASGGLYTFTDLIPGGYYVEFIQPTGYTFTLRDQGTDNALDSDPDRATGRTANLSLVSNQNDTTWDAGLYQPASLGNFVWRDINNNGIQDTGETGVGGVSVSLFTSGGALVAATTTASDGSYLFSGLIPGDYYVIFTLPDGYVFSPQNQGSNDGIDSDADGTTGQTATTTLVSGENDLSWDAGLHLVARIGVAKRVVGAPMLVSTGTWDVTFEILVRNYGAVPVNDLQVVENLTDTFPLPAAFTVRSVSSPNFTVNWPGFNGSTQTNLLAGNNSLNVQASGIIQLVVRVIPTASAYLNSVTASGKDSFGNTTTDGSDNGDNPDGDGDGDPLNDNDPTPVNFGDGIFAPPIGFKKADDRWLPSVSWTVMWINNQNIVPIAAMSNDPIPVGLTYKAEGASSGYPVPVTAPAGSTNVGVSCLPDPGSLLTTTQLCYYEGPTPANPRGQVIWKGSLGPDFGKKDVLTAKNKINITFATVASPSATQAINVATIDFDRNGDGDMSDAGERQVATATATVSLINEAKLPATGFAPGAITALPQQPADSAYNALSSVRLEIPTLRVNAPILGIPFNGDSWDVTWLDQGVGWLDGTAFPGRNGNSVLTGHVFGANGLPGPFVNLSQLKWGDRLIVYAFGQKYTFEVRVVKQVKPTDSSALAHKDTSWLTLITCKEYDDILRAYKWRVVVQGVLLKIEDE